MKKTFWLWFVVILLCALAGALDYFGLNYYRHKNKTNDAGPMVSTNAAVAPANEEIQANTETNTVSSGVSSNSPVATTTTLTGKALYLDRSTNKIVSIDLATKTQSDYLAAPTGSEMIDAKASHDGQALFAITQHDNNTFLNQTPLSNISFQQIDKGVPNKSNEDISGRMISAIKFFSPHDRYLTYTWGGYEACGDVYYSLKSRGAVDVPAESCDTTRWSKSGLRLVKYTSSGMVTGDGLALSPAGDISTFEDIDLTKLMQDINITAGFSPASADFVDDQTLIVGGATWVNNGPEPAARNIVFSYSDTAKKATLVTQFNLPDGDFVSDIRYADSGTIYVTGVHRFYRISLGDGKLTEVVLPGASVTDSTSIKTKGAFGNYLIVSYGRDDSDLYKNKEGKLYLINVKTGSIDSFDVNSGQFVGLLP